MKVREYVFQKGVTPSDLKNRTMLGSADDAKREVSQREVDGDLRWVVTWSFTPR